jgi:peptidoglycan/LPS O-acetylase OafA/YrhL
VSSTPLPVRSPHERFYHPELDALRFVAFFLIFLHHSMPHLPDFYTKLGSGPTLALLLASLASTGAMGVQLFFLLSSYLVTELLLRERATRGQIDLRAFFVRRILRIWPLYYTFLAFAWIIQWYLPGQHIGWRAGLAFTLFAGNWWVVFVGFPSSVIFPLWFLSLQEQFYLFWPAVVRKLSRRGLLMAAAAILAAASLTRWHLALRHTWESRMWCNTFVQLDAVALGIILAVLLAGRAPRVAPFVRAALAIGGAACLVFAACYFRIKFDPLTTPRVLLGYPVAALGAVALFLAILHEQKPAQIQTAPLKPSVGLSRAVWKPLVYLGRISYGLYVFHILGLMTSDYLIPNAQASLGRYLFHNAAALGVTIVLAAISYRWLETPFLTLKRRFTRVLSGPSAPLPT